MISQFLKKNVRRAFERLGLSFRRRYGSKPRLERAIKVFLVLLCVLCGISQWSMAQGTEEPQAGEVDTVDQVITNKMLRAQSGSLSKWSVSTGLGYSAGSLEKPLDAVRPNITDSNQNATSLQNIGGSVGVKYRATELSSISVSGGLRMQTPFQSTYSSNDPNLQRTFDENHGRFDFNNPTAGYGYVFRWLGAQNYLTLQQTLTTDTGLRRSGYLTNTSVYHTWAYEIPATRLTFMWRWNVTYFFFDRVSGIEPSKQTEYQVGVSPTLEYALSDRFNLRTEVGFGYEHTKDRAHALSFRGNRVAQTVGLGISITRDIFLFPNIQFLPEDVRAQKTNIGLSTNINIF